MSLVKMRNFLIFFICHLCYHDINCETTKEKDLVSNSNNYTKETIEHKVEYNSIIVTKDVSANLNEDSERTKVISTSVLCLVLICVIIGLILLSQVILHLRNFIQFGIFPSVCEKCWWETRYPNWSMKYSYK